MQELHGHDEDVGLVRTSSEPKEYTLGLLVDIAHLLNLVTSLFQVFLVNADCINL